MADYAQLELENVGHVHSGHCQIVAGDKTIARMAGLSEEHYRYARLFIAAPDIHEAIEHLLKATDVLHPQESGESVRHATFIVGGRHIVRMRKLLAQINREDTP